MIKFCPDLTSKEEVVPITIGTGTFTRPVLHACLQNKCVAYKFGNCLKYNTCTEYGYKSDPKEEIINEGCGTCLYEHLSIHEEPCAHCTFNFEPGTVRYNKAKDCYVRKVDTKKE